MRGMEGPSRVQKCKTHLGTALAGVKTFIPGHIKGMPKNTERQLTLLFQRIFEMSGH